MILCDDGAKDRAHAADDNHGKYQDDEIGAHDGTDLVDRCSEDSGGAGERDADAETERHQRRHVDAESTRQARILRRSLRKHIG